MTTRGSCRRTLQVHPTRLCNLRCRHCYSSSGPEERGGLDIELLRGVVTDACEQGFAVMSVSGGEPLLYTELTELLDHARRHGMTTAITTNGTLLHQRNVDRIRGRVDVLAVSVDGTPESHDRIRGERGAFVRMAKNLELVRAAGLAFGFIFTLTQFNADELLWVAEFARDQGARLLQIHPLDEVGRARAELAGARPDAREVNFGLLAALSAQQICGDEVKVKLDLASVHELRREPGRVFAHADEPDESERPLAEIASPLIVEDDGAVVPMQYGFPRRYALGNLRERRLRDMLPEWRARGFPAFRELCRAVHARAIADDEAPLLDWTRTLSTAAAESAQLLPLRKRPGVRSAV